MWGRQAPLCFLYSRTVTHDILAGDWRWSIIRGQVVLWIRGSCAGGTSEVKFMEEMSWSFTGYIGALTLGVLGRGKDESKHFLYLYSQFGTHLWMTGWRRFPVVNPLKTLWHSFHLRLTAFCLCLPLSPWDAAHEDSLVDRLGIDSGNGSCLVQALQGGWHTVPHSSLFSHSKEFHFDWLYEGRKDSTPDPLLIAICFSHWSCVSRFKLTACAQVFLLSCLPRVNAASVSNRLPSHGQTFPPVKLPFSLIACFPWHPWRPLQCGLGCCLYSL